VKGGGEDAQHASAVSQSIGDVRTASDGQTCRAGAMFFVTYLVLLSRVECLQAPLNGASVHVGAR
jgi:hypothetical protein